MQTDTQTDRQTDRHIDTQTHRPKKQIISKFQIDRRSGIRTDGQAGRQTW